LDKLSIEEQQKEQYFLIKTSHKHINMWGDVFRPILIDYMPDNFWLVHTNGKNLFEIINNFEKDSEKIHKLGAFIDAIMYFPKELRISEPVTQFLSLRDRNSSPIGLQSNLERQYRILNGEIKPDNLFKQKNNETNRETWRKKLSKFRSQPDNITPLITDDLDIMLSESTKYDEYGNIQSPHRVLKHDDMFNDLILFNQKLTLMNRNLPLERNVNSYKRQNLIQNLKNYFFSLPNFLHNFEDLYQLIESDIEDGIMFEDPSSLRDAITIDSFVQDPNYSQIGQLFELPTQSFLTFFTESNLNNSTETFEYNYHFNQHGEILLSKLNQNYEQKYQQFINRFDSNFVHNEFTDASTRLLNDVFDMFNIDKNKFKNNFQQNSNLLHRSQTSSNSQAPSRSPQSILPFNIVLQHSTRPVNTILDSKIAMNNVRVQFQSPLFHSNTTFITSAIANRVSTFYNFVKSIDDKSEFFQNNDENNDEGNDGNNDEKMISYSEFKTLLAEQYFSQIFNHKGRKWEYNDETKRDIYTTYDNYKPHYNSRAATLQYIDTLIMSLFDTVLSQNTPKSTNKNSLQNLLSQSDLNTLLTTLIQHQINSLNQLTADCIEEILISDNLYTIELDTQSSLFNHYARYALSIGLDNIPVGYDQPPKMTATGPYYDAGVTGRGIIVSVADTGADTGSCFLNDLDTSHAIPFTTKSNVETSSNHRKFKSYLTLGDKYDYLNGHGSHVVGSVVSGSSTTGSTIYSVHDGALPQGQVAFTDIAVGSAIIAGLDFAVVFQHALVNGAIITSNSWGTSATKINHIAQNNYYSASKGRAMDQWLVSNPGLAALFASSNDGLVGFGTLTQQANSKNTVVIGSVQASKAQGVYAKDSNKDLPSFYSNPSAFSNLHNLYGGSSSMGPTKDGRIKPDFVAPGVSVVSIAATAKSTKTCGWVVKTGTSMATPTTAGLWGVMQEMLMEGRVNSGHPNSSKAYTKESITGSFLRVLAMNSAQRVSYRASYNIAEPQPLKIQKITLPAITTSQGVTYKHLKMGIVNGLKFAPSSTQSYYIRPTRTDPFVKNTDRFIRVMPYTECQAANYEIVAYLGTDQGPGPNFRTQRFGYQEFEAQKRSTLDFYLSSNEQIYLSFNFGSPACTGQNELNFIIQEFVGESYQNSQRFVDAKCDDLFTDFPEYSLPNFNNPSLYIRCPPTPACTDTFSNAPVYGNRHYSSNSSVCRAALHTGAVNVTLHDLTDATEAQKHVNNNAWQTVIVQANPAVATLRIEPASKWFSVSSQYFNSITADLDVFGFQVGGDVLPDNDLMYLRPLPPTQNTASGWGLPKLSTIFPLTNHVVMSSGDNEMNSVQRQLVVFSQGLESQSLGLKNGESNSHCFYVSSKPLLNKYIENSSDMWTSGEDNVRVSMAYYDQPGAAATNDARNLVNDLDLFVFGPDGSEFRGNQRADRLNNAERVDLLQGTFTPGMYCAVVHGVNVPLGTQHYALVANGRGAEHCLANPAGNTISGIWSMKNTEAKCEKTDPNNFIDPVHGYDMRDIYHNIGSDPQDSIFHQDISSFQIRNGGDCWAMHNISYEQKSTERNKFAQQRKSTTKWEQIGDWDQDSKNGFGGIKHNTKFVFSGKILSSQGDLFGFAYENQTDKTYDYSKPLENQIVEVPINGKVNQRMMQGNVQFIIRGRIQGNGAKMVLIGANYQCTYSLARTDVYQDVQYKVQPV
jgi:hypothetical protein